MAKMAVIYKFMAKIIKYVWTTVIYIFAGVSKYLEGSMFFADKIWFCLSSKFWP